MPNQRTIRHYEKVFFKYLRKNISPPRVSKTLNPPPCRGCDSARLDFGQILDFFFFFQRLCTEFSKNFPIPLGIRESFREIVARCKRVKTSCSLALEHFSSTRRYKHHQNKGKVKGLGRNSSYLAGFSIFFFSWFYEKVQSVG